MRQTPNPILGSVIIITALALCSLPNVGHAADATTTVEGKTLKLIGTGLREFLFIDIYRMSAYSESGDCKPGKIVYANEIKSFRLAMLKNLPAERLRSNFRDTLEGSLPKDKGNSAVQKKIEGFLTLIKTDVQKGAYVELTYIPGKGTLLKLNGKRLGVTPGKDFADLLWSSYFGANTCCSKLKSDILKACKNK